jgi:hypothetical protein
MTVQCVVVTDFPKLDALIGVMEFNLSDSEPREFAITIEVLELKLPFEI